MPDDTVGEGQGGILRRKTGLERGNQRTPVYWKRPIGSLVLPRKLSSTTMVIRDSSLFNVLKKNVP